MSDSEETLGNSDWKKVIVSGSHAEVKSLNTSDSFTVNGAIIDFRDLPTSDPHIIGRLWRNPTSNAAFVRVSKGTPSGTN